MRKWKKCCARIRSYKRFMACFCAFALSVSLITVYPSPVFAEEQTMQTTPSDGQEENDGRLYVDGVIYNGYYMNKTGIMYMVSHGVAEPITKMAGKGTIYYSEAEKTQKSLPMQTVFVKGRAYTGYYMDGKKMYHVKKGSCTLKTGRLTKGTKYYSYKDGKKRKLSKQTLYVKGKVYTGYYMDSKNKMYHVKKGSCTLKTGRLKKGTRYYSYKAKKKRKVSKQTLYVKGKIYTGYYMDSKNKMYHVKKGSCTLKTGRIEKGTKYYSYKAKKKRKISKQTLYVKGKVYTGYYMDSKNKMYGVKKGICALITGMLDAGTKYYSYKAKKNVTLPNQTLYVDGVVYNGYYLSSDNRMYLLSNGTYIPVNTVLNGGTAYFDCNINGMRTLPFEKVYLDGKAVEGLSANGIATFQKARAVVQAVSNPTDDKADKLYKCYLWIKRCPYVQYRTTVAAVNADPADWDSTFANDIFDKGSGCCASLACAFAYMAKACGYEKVTICSDTEHAWVDIDGRLYDPLFARDRNFSSNYNAAYTDYRVHAAITRDL